MTRAATRIAVPAPARAPAAAVALPKPLPRALADAEREADQVAESVVNGEAVAGSRLSQLPGAPAGRPGESPSAPPAGGQPLPPDQRAAMQRQLGHDFGSVRVHSGSEAGAAARGLHAHAFTVGEHVVLGSGLPGPHTPAGRRVLAHELVHVVQQRHRPARVQRLGFWESIGVFFGTTEGTFSREELHAYLDKVTKARDIERSYDSDNKARAIVRRYKTGDLEFDLAPEQKTLLIEEMLHGPTMAEDEDAIVTLLELSDDTDLGEIFFFGGITYDRLESDIGGDALARLDALVATRFDGGLAALRAGRIDAKGLKRREFDQPAITAALASGETAAAIVAELQALEPPARERATRLLGKHRAEIARQISTTGDQIEAEPDQDKKAELKKQQAALQEQRLRVDLVLQRLQLTVATSQSRETLLESATTPPPGQLGEIKTALSPEPAKVDPVTGQPEPFVETLPGETETYGQKLSAALPAVIQASFDAHMAGKSEKEHEDPKKTHKMSEMERVAGRAKVESDAVFGHLAKGPPLRGDQPDKRGNLHDLFVDFGAKLAKLDDDQKRQLARPKVLYFLVTETALRQISRAHNADPKVAGGVKNPEAKIQDKVADDATAKDKMDQVNKINEIQRRWAATAGGGHVNIQLFKPLDPTTKNVDVDKDRAFLWDMFQTIIHEYMHTLTHEKYREYANSFGYGSAPHNTLIEGVDCVLSETVWANVAPRVEAAGLRKDVEGPEYADLAPIKVKHPSQVRRYASYAEATKLFALVGAPNVYVAFFLGDVKRIGAP